MSKVNSQRAAPAPLSSTKTGSAFPLQMRRRATSPTSSALAYQREKPLAHPPRCFAGSAKGSVSRGSATHGPFPSGVSFKNLTPQQAVQLLEQLQALLDVGAIEPSTRARWMSQAFLVKKPGAPGKWRLVVDLRHVNQYLRKFLCRFETLKRLPRIMREGDWMLNLDPQDGFYAVGVNEDHRDYLTFEVAGLGLFRFKALPMGLSASPGIFTATVNTFVRALRSPLAPTTPPKRRTNYDLSRASRAPRRRMPHRRAKTQHPAADVPTIRGLQARFPRLMQSGARVLPYMDDFLLIAATRAEAFELREYTEAVLDTLGLQRNVNKGVWNEPGFFKSCRVLFITRSTFIW